MGGEKKVVRLGVMGTAGVAWGMSLEGMVNAENCRIEAIAGRKKEKVEAFQKKFHIPKGYTDYEDMLKDPDIDAVYIPLPINLHKEWTIKAADYGKHILCEKPLAPTEKDVKEMYEHCDSRGVKLMEAIPYLNTPYFTRIKEIVSSGEIGDVISILSVFLTMRHDHNDIRYLKNNFGGTIYDMSCYNTSLPLALFDELPVRVHATSTMTEENIDDTAAIIMDFGTSLERRAFAISGMALGEEQLLISVSINGTKGRLEIPHKAYNQQGEIPLYIVGKDSVRIENFENPNNYTLEISNFADSILYDKPLPVTRKLSIMNAHVLDEALKEINY